MVHIKGQVSAKAFRVQRNSHRWREWLENHRIELKVGTVFALFAFFFSHGLPLWDDDYSVWLAQANGSFVDLVVRILSPLTSDPAGWGYSDRPVEILIYKISSLLFGTWGTGYFFVKSVVFGALCGSLYHWMRKLNVSHRAACMSLAMFALSANVMAALLWHSDFAFYAQLILVVLLMSGISAIERGPANSAAFRQAISRGWDNLPSGYLRFCIFFFAAVYFGSKIRGDVRLAPVVLLTWLAVYRREKLRVWLVPFGASFLATLPWSSALFKHLPPFIPGAAGWQGWTFTPFSVGRAFQFLAGDFFSTFASRAAPLAVLGGIGSFIVVAALFYGAFRAEKQRLGRPDRTWGLFTIWFAIALLGAGTLAVQAHSFQIRYTTILLVPAVMLLALITQAAWKDFGGKKFFSYAIPALFVLQGAVHLFKTVDYRKDMGHTLVAIEKLYTAVEKDYGSSNLLMGPGFLPYAFRESKAPAIAGKKSVGSWDELSRYPANGTFVASWNSTLDPRLSVAYPATGCGASMFDAIAGCKPSEGAFLLRYVGNLPELEQSNQLDRQGNLLGARQVLESYLQRDPNNHGVIFASGLQAYRLGDFAKMEQAYEKLAEYFPSHPSVIYNLGLAKQGLQKYAEASKLLERVYATVPKDYAIGFNLADTYYKLGKKKRALATLDELRQAYPGNKPLADAYLKWSQ